MKMGRMDGKRQHTYTTYIILRLINYFVSYLNYFSDHDPYMCTYFFARRGVKTKKVKKEPPSPLRAHVCNDQ